MEMDIRASKLRMCSLVFVCEIFCRHWTVHLTTCTHFYKDRSSFITYSNPHNINATWCARVFQSSCSLFEFRRCHWWIYCFPALPHTAACISCFPALPQNTTSICTSLFTNSRSIMFHAIQCFICQTRFSTFKDLESFRIAYAFSTDVWKWR